MMDDYEDVCSTYIYSLRSNWEKLKQNSRHLENLFVFIIRFHSLILYFPAGNNFFLWFKLCVDNNLCLHLSKLMACSLKMKVEILTRLDPERYLHRIDIASSPK
jgi:hypothetical protein